MEGEAKVSEADHSARVVTDDEEARGVLGEVLLLVFVVPLAARVLFDGLRELSGEGHQVVEVLPDERLAVGELGARRERGGLAGARWSARRGR